MGKFCHSCLRKLFAVQNPHKLHALLILYLFILQRRKAKEFLKMIISIQFAIKHKQTVINMFGFLGIFVKISVECELLVKI